MLWNRKLNRPTASDFPGQSRKLEFQQVQALTSDKHHSNIAWLTKKKAKIVDVDKKGKKL